MIAGMPAALCIYCPALLAAQYAVHQGFSMIGYFPTRVPKVPQDCRQTPRMVGSRAILKLPKLTFVWAESVGARCRLV
jgi:hypothetical protein